METNVFLSVVKRLCRKAGKLLPGKKSDGLKRIPIETQGIAYNSQDERLRMREMVGYAVGRASNPLESNYAGNIAWLKKFARIEAKMVTQEW